MNKMHFTNDLGSRKKYTLRLNRYQNIKKVKKKKTFKDTGYKATHSNNELYKFKFKKPFT